MNRLPELLSVTFDHEHVIFESFFVPTAFERAVIRVLFESRVIIDRQSLFCGDMLCKRALLRIPYRSTTITHPSSLHLNRGLRAMLTTESLTAEIAQQQALFNELRLQNIDALAIDAAKKKLGELKKSLAAIGKAEGNAGGVGGSESKDGKKKERLLLKTAKVGLGLHTSCRDRRWPGFSDV
jgi:hypothetical protein